MAQTQRDVSLIYEGTDITEDVDLIECNLKDVSSGASDLLNVKLDHAENWFRWRPQKNDRLQVKRGGFDSGTLYLNTIAPEDGAYRIIATSAKCQRFPKRWQAFEDKSFGAIMSLCAAECGMSAQLYGANSAQYEYLLREYMRAPEFMALLAGREGAVLKAVNGKFAVIGVQYAQQLPAMHVIQLDSDQMDSSYLRLQGHKWSSVQIDTPFGSGEANDADGGGQKLRLCHLSVDNDAMAKRWARGILLMHNRQSETLTIEMDFNPGYTAMVRVDAESDTDANGRWIIDSVEQNLLEGRTKAVMYRCIEGL